MSFLLQGEVERLLRAGKAELSPELMQLQECLRVLPASGVDSLRASQSLPSGFSTHRWGCMWPLGGTGLGDACKACGGFAGLPRACWLLAGHRGRQPWVQAA